MFVCPLALALTTDQHLHCRAHATFTCRHHGTLVSCHHPLWPCRQQHRHHCRRCHGLRQLTLMAMASMRLLLQPASLPSWCSPDGACQLKERHIHCTKASPVCGVQIFAAAARNHVIRSHLTHWLHDSDLHRPDKAPLSAPLPLGKASLATGAQVATGRHIVALATGFVTPYAR